MWEGSRSSAPTSTTLTETATASAASSRHQATRRPPRGAGRPKQQPAGPGSPPAGDNSAPGHTARGAHRFRHGSRQRATGTSPPLQHRAGAAEDGQPPPTDPTRTNRSAHPRRRPEAPAQPRAAQRSPAPERRTRPQRRQEAQPPAAQRSPAPERRTHPQRRQHGAGTRPALRPPVPGQGGHAASLRARAPAQRTANTSVRYAGDTYDSRSTRANPGPYRHRRCRRSVPAGPVQPRPDRLATGPAVPPSAAHAVGVIQQLGSVMLGEDDGLVMVVHGRLLACLCQPSCA
jgi:hypothetical protein